MRGLILLLTLACALPAQAEGLEGAEWRVSELAGVALSGEGGPTLAFLGGGRVAGHAGCNRFVGTWSQDGTALAIGPLVTTRMACEATRMDLERRFLAALTAVRTLAVSSDGALDLLGAGGLLIRARRP